MTIDLAAIDAPLLVLLPPSEGKAESGDGPSWSPRDGAYESLGDRRAEVAAALAAQAGGSATLLGVKGERLATAQERNRSLIGAPTLPAWKRYTGVVWDHLEPASLPAVARRRITVLSGLLGLARGDDPVPEYRLRMGASLSPLGRLSTWWRDDVSAGIDRAARRRFVVDLLPKEHRAAWVPTDRIRGIRVEFVDADGRSGGHFAKAAKGRLARGLLQDGLEAIAAWEDERHRLQVEPIGSVG